MCTIHIGRFSKFSLWFDSITRKRKHREKERKKIQTEIRLSFSIFQVYTSRSAFMCCYVCFLKFSTQFEIPLERRQPASQPAQRQRKRKTQDTNMAHTKRKTKPLWISNYRPATSYKVKNERKKNFICIPLLRFALVWNSKKTARQWKSITRKTFFTLFHLFLCFEMNFLWNLISILQNVCCATFSLFLNCNNFQEL